MKPAGLQPVAVTQQRLPNLDSTAMTRAGCAA